MRTDHDAIIAWINITLFVCLNFTRFFSWIVDDNGSVRMPGEAGNSLGHGRHIPVADISPPGFSIPRHIAAAQHYLHKYFGKLNYVEEQSA